MLTEIDNLNNIQSPCDRIAKESLALRPDQCRTVFFNQRSKQSLIVHRPSDVRLILRCGLVDRHVFHQLGREELLILSYFQRHQQDAALVVG